MDKYEFNIKVEQIKKLVNKGDYETAMKIADTIDWRRVRSTSLLTMVAQVYERNEEYQDAKDILLLAFERAPIGKGLLFKLTDLALREKNIPEAEAYYREFCDLSADDPRQNLLRYLILEAKGAPMDQRIKSLEKYSREDLDEKWLYKLAELYHETGDEDACVRMCDKIMLLFGLGKYVDKAMELKLQHAPLTDYQMDLVENREKYEEQLREVEQRFTGASGQEREDDFDEDEEFPPIPEFSEQEEEAEEDLAKEVSMLESFETEESVMGTTRVIGDICAIKHLYQPNRGTEETAVTAGKAAEEPDSQELEEGMEIEDDTIFEDWDLEPEEEVTNHLMIEAEHSENGLALALSSLKRIHSESGSKNPVAKISGENLNKKGIFAVSDRLAGKDLIVEHAADLNAVTVTELSELMEQDDTGMIVVLIDTPLRMERLHNSNPKLAGKFHYIGCEKEVIRQSTGQSEIADRMAEIPEAPVQHEAAENITARWEEEIERPLVQDTEVLSRAAVFENTNYTNQEDAEPHMEPYAEPEDSYGDNMDMPEEPEFQGEENMDDDREMDVEEFAQYACKYAAEIDCSVSGKSMLALYERVEMMEEDNVPLTKANAEELMEEAADKAEKPGFMAIFSSKYDKDGLLILKEKHFFD